MSYSEWVELFEKFKNTNTDKELLNELLSKDNNPSIADRFAGRYSILINERLQLSVDKLTIDIELMFKDQNYMDFALVTFKKEVNYLLDMLGVKFLNEESRNVIYKQIKDKVDEIYKILDKKALEIDYTGVLSMMIKNNGIKWS